MNFKERRKTKLLVAGILSVFGIVGALHIAFGKLFYSNVSPSAPQGLYIATPIQSLTRGDYVVVRLPEAVESLHVKKDYLLLKRVQGFPGESYTIDASALRTEQRSYPICRSDLLPQQEQGTYIVPEGELLLLNDPDDSFDSRYLGSIKQTQIDKKVLLLLSYDNPVVNSLKEVFK